MENETKDKIIKYSQPEEIYIGDIKKKLELARDKREEPHDEFDGMNYTQNFYSNEKGANTYIEPKKHKYDSNYQSGTIRSKLFTLLSSINNLNLSPDISAFDSDNREIMKLGNAMEQIILETEDLENDEEKKIYRQYELLKQGDVFIEEIWKEKFVQEKKMTKDFDGSLSAKWSKKLRKDKSYCERNIISGLGVFLGDIRQLDIEKQPFLFTIEVIPYEIAEKRYKKWDRWTYVPKKIVQNKDTEADVLYGWNITEVEDDMVEIIRYQDKPNNEYAIFMNGVLMTPKGLPFQWGWEGYNITQQGLEPITATFVYHKSLVSRLKANTAILDEMLRLSVLKTKKSFSPPRFNLSGRVLSSNVFMPEVITNGINPNQVPLADEKEAQGVTNSEMAMIKQLQETNDFNSVSPSFQGQQTQGQTTATEVLQMQRQSKLALGLVVNMCALLEWKLSWLRLFNILENWFDPIDTEVDEVRQVLKDKYRVVNRKTIIEGEGQGRMMIIPSKENRTGQEIYNEEEEVKKRTGSPIRIISINPQELKSVRNEWQIVIRPREKKTSELSKLMNREMLNDLTIFIQSGLVNMGYLQEQVAEVWEKDPEKLFNRGQGQGMMAQGQGQSQVSASGQGIEGQSPNAKRPALKQTL